MVHASTAPDMPYLRKASNLHGCRETFKQEGSKVVQDLRLEPPPSLAAGNAAATICTQARGGERGLAAGSATPVPAQDKEYHTIQATTVSSLFSQN